VTVFPNFPYSYIAFQGPVLKPPAASTPPQARQVNCLAASQLQPQTQLSDSGSWKPGSSRAVLFEEGAFVEEACAQSEYTMRRKKKLSINKADRQRSKAQSSHGPCLADHLAARSSPGRNAAVLSVTVRTAADRENWKLVEHFRFQPFKKCFRPLCSTIFVPGDFKSSSPRRMFCSLECFESHWHEKLSSYLNAAPETAYAEWSVTLRVDLGEACSG
jgi:hypothetical protein